jgi:precorrin-6A/cobalt-precorrin-6A reductase
MKRLLILGGTGEATELAKKAATIPHLDVLVSLAGRTRQPMNQLEKTRVGSFGGEAGLIHFLQEQQIDLLIDATHPFAAQISFNAARAANYCKIPWLHLVRLAWEAVNGDRWIEVESNQAAADVLPEIAHRIFLTIGRQELSTFAHLQDLWFLMRMVDPPQSNEYLPPGKLLLKRGPFSLEDERSLLQMYEIGAIVSKNSGGDATYAKILAARELDLPVVMIQRPPVPAGEHASDVETALSWLMRRLSSG